MPRAAPFRVRADDGRMGWVANWLTAPAPEIKPRLFAVGKRGHGGAPPKARARPVAAKAPGRGAAKAPGRGAAKAPGRGAPDIGKRLRKLKSLYREELITKEEYQAKRRELLKDL